MIFCAFDAEVGARPFFSPSALMIVTGVLLIAAGCLTVWLARHDKKSPPPADSEQKQDDDKA